MKTGVEGRPKFTSPMPAELCALAKLSQLLGQHLLPLSPWSCHRAQKQLRELGHKQSLISSANYRTTYSLKWEEMLVMTEVVLEPIQGIKVILFKNTGAQVILEPACLQCHLGASSQGTAATATTSSPGTEGCKGPTKERN